MDERRKADLRDLRRLRDIWSQRADRGDKGAQVILAAIESLIQEYEAGEPSDERRRVH